MNVLATRSQIFLLCCDFGLRASFPTTERQCSKQVKFSSDHKPCCSKVSSISMSKSICIPCPIHLQSHHTIRFCARITYIMINVTTYNIIQSLLLNLPFKTKTFSKTFLRNQTSYLGMHLRDSSPEM